MRLTRGTIFNPTRWILEEEYRIFYGKTGINWYSPDGWLKIVDGVWIVRPGYVWDGCTDVLDFKSDLDTETKKPKTYYPSLCHDVGYRYLAICPESFPYNKFKIDFFFFRLLRKFKFRFSKLYFVGVLIFGQFYMGTYETQN